MQTMVKHYGLHAIVLTFAALLAAPAANAQSTVLEMMTKLHAPPDEHYFFEADRKQVVDYKTDRVVRICAGESRHVVPLKVTYDDKTTTLGSGDCTRVEAKQVFLEPEERLDPSWVIKADVDTVE